jgi:hypothetical protein
MASQLHVLVPDDLRQWLQAYADERAISVSDAVRLILREKRQNA